jgi:hypothetical protein
MSAPDFPSVTSLLPPGEVLVSSGRQEPKPSHFYKNILYIMQPFLLNYGRDGGSFQTKRFLQPSRVPGKTYFKDEIVIRYKLTSRS